MQPKEPFPALEMALSFVKLKANKAACQKAWAAPLGAQA